MSVSIQKCSMVILFPLLIAFSGCSFLGEPRQADQRHSFRPTINGDGISQLKCKEALIIGNIRSIGAGGGTRLVFSPDEKLRQHYQFSRWSEPFTQRLGVEAQLFFLKSGQFSSVNRATDLRAGSYLLRLDLLDAFHAAHEEPGDVVLDIQAAFQQAESDGPPMLKRFTVREPASEFSAKGAVDGFETAFNTVMNEILQWIGEHC